MKLNCLCVCKSVQEIRYLCLEQWYSPGTGLLATHCGHTSTGMRQTVHTMWPEYTSCGQAQSMHRPTTFTAASQVESTELSGAAAVASVVTLPSTPVVEGVGHAEVEGPTATRLSNTKFFP
jgi:hypothetical protein